MAQWSDGGHGGLIMRKVIERMFSRFLVVLTNGQHLEGQVFPKTIENNGCSPQKFDHAAKSDNAYS